MSRAEEQRSDRAEMIRARKADLEALRAEVRKSRTDGAEEDRWWYSPGQHGPVLGPVGRRFLGNEARLAADSGASWLVWQAGWEWYKPLPEALAIEQRPAPSPPVRAQLVPSIEAPLVVSPESVPREQTLPKAATTRPFRRYFARTFDETVLILVLFALAMAGELPVEIAEVVRDQPILLVFAAPLLWLLLEIPLLAMFGSTPGKALYAIRVLRADGRVPSLFAAGARSATLAIRGLALGFPTLSLIAQGFAFARLQQRGRTSWDEAQNLRVEHREWSGNRALLCVIAALFALGLRWAWFGILQA